MATALPYRTLAILSAISALVAGIAPAEARSLPDQGPPVESQETSQGQGDKQCDLTPLEEIARDGKMFARHPESFATHFGMPSGKNDLWMYQLSVEHPNEPWQGVWVRVRKNRSIDLILIRRIVGSGTDYFKTSSDGKLLQAVHVKAGVYTELSSDADRNVFEWERAFWLEYIKKKGKKSSLKDKSSAEEQNRK